MAMAPNAPPERDWPSTPWQASAEIIATIAPATTMPMVRMSVPKLDERHRVALPGVEVNRKFVQFLRRSVEVTGTQRMDAEFVRWAAGIEPGEPYDPDTLTRARDRLQRLGPLSTT
jgi:hypothetical protein